MKITHTNKLNFKFKKNRSNFYLFQNFYLTHSYRIVKLLNIARIFKTNP